jgi:3',5'-cyclic AMP phosphodiesterase CpdA
LPPFRLAHISDLHLPPPSMPAGAAGIPLKARLSRLAWRRKRHGHSPEVLAAIVADLQTQGPDHIAITGDLTNFSSSEEFAAAGEWLRRLAPSDAVTVSPGNHDALVGAGGPERFAAWRAWLGDDEALAFPQVRRRGPVALVNLCSAIPTAPHLAQGALGRAQLERLPSIRRDLKAEGLCRVLLIHHPPVAGAVSGRKALKDARALQAVLAVEGAELVLHGHAHRATVGRLTGPDHPVPVLGAPSASAVGEGGASARWQAYDIAREGAGWSIGVTARGLDAQGSGRELGRYRLRGGLTDSASSPAWSDPPAAAGSGPHRTPAG